MPLNREWDVEIVMNHFQRELESREMCRFSASTNLETKDQCHQQYETCAASGLVTGTTSDTRERQISFTYC